MVSIWVVYILFAIVMLQWALFMLMIRLHNQSREEWRKLTTQALDINRQYREMWGPKLPM